MPMTLQTGTRWDAVLQFLSLLSLRLSENRCLHRIHFKQPVICGLGIFQVNEKTNVYHSVWLCTKSILMCSLRRSWTCQQSSLIVSSLKCYLIVLTNYSLALFATPFFSLQPCIYFFTLPSYIPSLLPVQTKPLLCASEALVLGKRWDVCLLFLWPITLRFTGCVWRMVMLASWLSVFSLSVSVSFLIFSLSLPSISHSLLIFPWMAVICQK